MSATETHTHPTLTPAERTRLGRRAQLLAGASVTYNVIEAVIAITAGIVAGSVALIGFGLDSVVEVSSGLIILWQFRHRLPESRERQALRLMAFSFFALAAYVTFESLRALLFGGEPEPSPVGIGLAIASLVIMPFLSWAQRRTGRALGSGAVVADSTQTLLCTYLSAVLLVGLVLNATLGWGWADPIAGLVIAAVAVNEGIEAWKGEGCCAPGGGGHAQEDACGCAEGCTDACCTSTATRPTSPRSIQITPRMATTRFFHTTDQAESILREGFRESEDSFMIRGRTLRGVWISDDPLDINEGAKGDQVFAVDLPLSLDELKQYEISEDGKGYHEWCVPAKIIPLGAITLLTEEEADAIGDQRFERRFKSSEAEDAKE